MVSDIVPISVSISIGLSTLEREYEDILLSLGASKFQIFYKIALPKTLPEFFYNKNYFAVILLMFILPI